MKKTNHKKLVYPKYDTEYWCLGTYVVCSIWYNDTTDKYRFNTGNYFTTEQEAKLEFEWRLVNTQILNSIASLNKEDNWVVDWKNTDQEKSYLTWEREEDRVEVGYDINEQTRPNNMYLYKDTAWQLVELYTQEELKFWITKEKDNETT